MTTGDILAKVIPLRRAKLLDAEAPIRKYSRAGLVNAQFGIEDGMPVFWGYHDPVVTWNGWATPKFSREVASLIADWVNGVEADTAWWEKSSLYVRSDDRAEVDRVEPDELDLYSFDGWTWLEADPRG